MNNKKGCLHAVSKHDQTAQCVDQAQTFNITFTFIFFLCCCWKKWTLFFSKDRL